MGGEKDAAKDVYGRRGGEGFYIKWATKRTADDNGTLKRQTNKTSLPGHE